MTAEQRKNVFDLLLKKISEQEFLRECGISRADGSKLSLHILEEGYRKQEVLDIEPGLRLGFYFGFLPEHFDILCWLSDADWHKQHEDVVTALDKLRDERAVGVLYRAALKLHPYLAYDDSRALAVKAIWALGRLGSAAADEKLRLLAQSNDPILSNTAQDQLKRAETNRKT